jgi:sodium-dependent dicarboxylate transporter 2/3/5
VTGGRGGTRAQEPAAGRDDSAATAAAPGRSGFRWPSDAPSPPTGPGRPVPEDTGAGGATRRWLRRTILGAGLAAAAAIYVAPGADGLTPQGQAACAIFLACTTLWLTNAIPVGITGLLAVALLGLTRAMSPADAFAAVGSSAVFFIIGVFILSAALVRSGLSTRLALRFLRVFGRSPDTLAAGLMLVACLTTVIMPAQATVAMLFPIAAELARAMRLRPGASAYGKVLFLSLAWGAMVGSNASFLGSTRAPLALGLLAQTHGTTISFARWLQAALPVVVLGTAAVPVLLRASFPREAVDAGAARAALDEAVARLGRIGRTQATAAAIMAATVLGWVFLGGRRVDLAVLALLGAAAMFAARVLEWEDLEGYVHWNVVLMYGGAIALGVALDRSGVARWLTGAVVGDVRVPPYLAVVGLGVATLVLSEFMSNAAAVAVMLPLGFSLGGPLGVAPEALVLAASVGAGLAFTLPVSSAPNTIAFASGYVGMADFARVGTAMTAISVLILLLVARVWWPLIGLL